MQSRSRFTKDLTMQKTIVLLFLVLATQLFSCKDEEAPAATISFTNEGTLVEEGVGDVTIPLALDRAPSNNLVVNYTMTGSAKLDDDYAATGSVEIAAGATEASISITVVDDNVFEFDRGDSRTLRRIYSNYLVWRYWQWDTGGRGIETKSHRSDRRE